MVSGLICVLIGTMMHGAITWGRILATSILIIGSLIGTRFEEKALIENVGKKYEKFMEHVPNSLIPDLMMLFYSDESLNEMRKQIENT
jgi:protein-S-isoprenylcysteine O-methyltransferase Ste14